jgi:hypothetical protein
MKHQHVERSELATVIENRAHEIVDRWLQQVRADAASASVPLTELQDGIADYLTRLAQLLRSDRALENGGTSAWNDIAREHAITRVRLGFDVTQLFHELVTLRRIITNVLDELGPLDGQQAKRLDELIDAAISASLVSYIDYRDYMTRRAEAEHIGFLSHELRNPLGAATLAAIQLRQQACSPEYEHLFELLDRSLERLRRMIDEALLAERLKIGEVESRPVDLKLQALIGDAIDVARRAAQQKDLELVTHCDPDLVLRVDPSLTLSALENLLDNAIKYSNAGKVALEIEEHADEIVFHVRDHCDGISPEEQRVIFEPFRRAHSTAPGSGLGLAIAPRAVEAQGGTIDVESRPDAGCHFWFKLPKTHH